MRQFLFSFIFCCICSNSILGQITLISTNNAPKGNYRYVYDTVRFNFSKSIMAGEDITWDLSDLLPTGTSSSFYFTRNPNYISFPGYDVPSYPDPTDTSYLYSDYAIYRTTDTVYSEVYSLCENPWGVQFVCERYSPILQYPYPYGFTMYYDSINGTGFWGYSDLTVYWKKSDAWGKLILPDTTYASTLRIHRYYKYDYMTGNHTGEGSTTEVFEWFDEHAEMCLLSVTTTYNYEWDYGPPYIVSQDTVAVVNTAKIYSPCSIGIENRNIDQGFSVYPNPASNFITIETSLPGQVAIKNIQGQELIRYQMTGPKKQIDISSLQRGIYYVTMKNQKTCLIRKIMKN